MGEINSDKRALLITGTIIPNSNFVAHYSLEQRKQEYVDGLLFYAEQFPNNDLYFLENSSYNFSTDVIFDKLFKEKNIILLKFPVSEKFNEGKGYQEFEMLDNAIDKLASRYTSFIKITGRYKVLNLKKLTDITCNTLIADSHKKFKVTQTNVFYVNTQFYTSYLKGLYMNVNDADGKFIEHVIYSKLQSNNLLSKTQLFVNNPIISGLSGSYGGTLNRNKYKMITRNLERKLLSVFKINQFIVEY